MQDHTCLIIEKQKESKTPAREICNVHLLQLEVSNWKRGNKLIKWSAAKIVSIKHENYTGGKPTNALLRVQRFKTQKIHAIKNDNVQMGENDENR